MWRSGAELRDEEKTKEYQANYDALYGNLKSKFEGEASPTLAFLLPLVFDPINFIPGTIIAKPFKAGAGITKATAKTIGVSAVSYSCKKEPLGATVLSVLQTVDITRSKSIRQPCCRTIMVLLSNQSMCITRCANLAAFRTVLSLLSSHLRLRRLRFSIPMSQRDTFPKVVNNYVINRYRKGDNVITQSKTRGRLNAICIFALVLASFATTAWALPVGNMAPNFTASHLDGKGKVKLSDYRGKVVLVDFWASWCPPCLKSLPQYNALRNELVEQGFEVIAVNVDQLASDGLRFLDKYPVSFPVVGDAKGVLPEQYQVKAMPTSFLLDQRGVVRYVHIAFHDGDIDVLRTEIMNLLAESK